mmetsp:Transcript_79564/g.215374  ORF Transcript_79564/g.215374 Transcript_79564/m.215374 type:complete len:271 (-) Transcript_79564:68-880(-)
MPPRAISLPSPPSANQTENLFSLRTPALRMAWKKPNSGVSDKGGSPSPMMPSKGKTPKGLGDSSVATTRFIRAHAAPLLPAASSSRPSDADAEQIMSRTTFPDTEPTPKPIETRSGRIVGGKCWPFRRANFDVLEALASKRRCLAHALDWHVESGTMTCPEPVSNMIVNSCGGFPIRTRPKYVTLKAMALVELEVNTGLFSCHSFTTCTPASPCSSGGGDWRPAAPTASRAASAQPRRQLDRDGLASESCSRRSSIWLPREIWTPMSLHK